MGANSQTDKVEFRANPKCKVCYGRGIMIRTWPVNYGGKKRMVRRTGLCHCAIEIQSEEVAETKQKTYATKTCPAQNSIVDA